MRYARGTTVGVDRSKAEIERVLMKYGASKFAYFNEGDRASIAFQCGSRGIRMRLPLPVPEDFMKTEKNRHRTPAARVVECDRSIKQRWRALLLIVKAKLEAIESKIATFDDEFLPYVVLPNGKTVAEQIGPQLDHGKSVLMLDLNEER